MSFLESLGSISPTWYHLQMSAGGNPYVQLPERPGGLLIFLTSLHPADNVAMASILEGPLFNRRLIGVPTPYTVADADSWITLQLSGQSGLALQALRSGDPDTGAFIGAVSLIPDNKSDISVPLRQSTSDKVYMDYELGYYLHPGYHRQGVMRDAVLALLAWATEECGVKNVFVDAEETNVASIKVIESIPVFLKHGTATEVAWPEQKGGGISKIWRWNYTC